MSNYRVYATENAVQSLAEKLPREVKKIDQTWEDIELTDDEFKECCTVPGEDGKDFVREEWRHKRQAEPWAELQVQFLR